MAQQESVRDNEWSWASPQLRERLLGDPASVLRDRGVNVPAELPLSIVQEFVRVVSLLWADGEITPLDRFYIDPADEGLLFGRGVWESTRTINGDPWLWSLHIDRLRQTAELLHMSVAPERLPDSEQVKAYVRSLTAQDVLVRLNVTAGRPGHPGIVWMSAAPRPYPAPSMRLQTRVNPVHKGQPYLLMKTFQYATRLRVGQEAVPAGFDSALLIDSEGNLLEAAHANLFVRLWDGWATPKPDGGLLPGTVRHYLLENSPLPVREQVIPRTLLREISEAFVTNSNVGIVPVTQIDEYAYPIGNETVNLMRWLEPPAATGVQYRFLERQVTPR